MLRPGGSHYIILSTVKLPHNVLELELERDNGVYFRIAFEAC